MKSFMPVCIEVSQARIVIVGGGRVALKKLRTISGYADNISVVAREILPDIKAMSIACNEGDYSPATLQGASLVYACTNDRSLNRRIREDGRQAGALVSVADDPESCDFIAPAIFRRQEMSVAVSSNGSQVKRTVRWRDAIKQFILNNPRLDAPDD